MLPSDVSVMQSRRALRQHNPAQSRHSPAHCRHSPAHFYHSPAHSRHVTVSRLSSRSLVVTLSLLSYSLLRLVDSQDTVQQEWTNEGSADHTSPVVSHNKSSQNCPIASVCSCQPNCDDSPDCWDGSSDITWQLLPGTAIDILLQSDVTILMTSLRLRCENCPSKNLKFHIPYRSKTDGVERLSVRFKRLDDWLIFCPSLSLPVKGGLSLQFDDQPTARKNPPPPPPCQSRIRKKETPPPFIVTAIQIYKEYTSDYENNSGTTYCGDEFKDEENDKDLEKVMLISSLNLVCPSVTDSTMPTTMISVLEETSLPDSPAVITTSIQEETTSADDSITSLDVDSTPEPTLPSPTTILPQPITTSPSPSSTVIITPITPPSPLSPITTQLTSSPDPTTTLPTTSFSVTSYRPTEKKTVMTTSLMTKLSTPSLLRTTTSVVPRTPQETTTLSTTTTSTTTITSVRVPLQGVKHYSCSFRVTSLQYEESLASPNTLSYTSLNSVVTPLLRISYGKALGEKFVGLSAVTFSSGSVVVTHTFDMTSLLDDVMRQATSNNTITEFKKNNFTVDSQSFKYKYLDETEKTVNVLLIALLTSFMLIFIIIIIVVALLLYNVHRARRRAKAKEDCSSMSDTAVVGDGARDYQKHVTGVGKSHGGMVWQGMASITGADVDTDYTTEYKIYSKSEVTTSPAPLCHRSTSFQSNTSDDHGQKRLSSRPLSGGSVRVKGPMGEPQGHPSGYLVKSNSNEMSASTVYTRNQPIVYYGHHVTRQNGGDGHGGRQLGRTSSWESSDSAIIQQNGYRNSKDVGSKGIYRSPRHRDRNISPSRGIDDEYFASGEVINHIEPSRNIRPSHAGYSQQQQIFITPEHRLPRSNFADAFLPSAPLFRPALIDTGWPQSRCDGSAVRSRDIDAESSRSEGSSGITSTQNATKEAMTRERYGKKSHGDKIVHHPTDGDAGLLRMLYAPTHHGTSRGRTVLTLRSNLHRENSDPLHRTSVKQTVKQSQMKVMENTIQGEPRTEDTRL